MSFDNWRKRLEIVQQHKTVATRREVLKQLRINFTQPQPEDEGYYRKPITVKHPTNGTDIIKGWIPVAYYLYNGVLVGNIGDHEQSREMTQREIDDEGLWSYVVANPIPHEWYVAVVERGDPWPDETPFMRALMDGASIQPANGAKSTVNTARMIEERADALAVAITPAETIPAANRDVAKTDNAPPAEEEVIPPVVQHATAIDNAIAAAPTNVTSEAEANVAAGSKNRIAELRLAAEKAGKAIYEPMYREYKRVQEVWAPPVNRAQAKEKALNTAILTFRESERRRLAAEAAKVAAEQAEAQRKIDEENERTAQRAIASGMPEAAPVVLQEAAPAAVPAPEPVLPTYGTRKVKEELKKFAVINDGVLVYKHFATDPAMVELLEKLTTTAIRSGQEVPGATFREGLI